MLSEPEVIEPHDIPLLDHQLAIVEDETSPILVLEGGLGSGKTVAGIFKMLALIEASPGVPGLWIEPTYDLVGTIVLPTVQQLFDEDGGLGIPWEYRTKWQGRPSVLLVHAGTHLETPVYLRSGDRPERIVGFKVGWFILDEADLVDVDVWRRASARLRDARSTVRQRVAVFTPEEGFGWTWQQFHERPEPGTRVIEGVSTRSNVFNPTEYVDTLVGTHDAEDAERVLTGKRKPKNGLVYKRFSEVNCAPCPRPTQDGQLFIGADFNVGVMAWVLGVRRGHDIYFWGEVVRENSDTISQCEAALDAICRQHDEDTGGKWHDRRALARSVQVVPDASCSQRRTSADGTASDLDHMVRFGFDVRRPSKNPPVRDRIFSVNLGFHEGRIFVDKQRCPVLYRSLCQQSWDMGRQEPDKSKGHDHAVDAAGYPIHFFEPSHLPRGNQRAPTERPWT